MQEYSNHPRANGQAEERKAFRFRTWRPRCGKGWLRIDQAIDEIGTKTFPDWGRQQDFDQLPLFRCDGILIRVAKGSKRKRFRTAPITDERPSPHHLADKYRTVYRKLRRAFRGSVTAKAITHTGVERSMRPAIYDRQIISIFGAGTVKIDGKRCPVWIDKKSFKEWMHDEFSIALSENERSALVDVLLDFRSSKKIKGLTRTDLTSIVSILKQAEIEPDNLSLLVDALSVRDFTLNGKPRKQTYWKEHAQELTDLMDLYLGRSPG